MVALLGADGRPIQRERTRSWRRVLAQYDAAMTTDENMRHWRFANGLSAAEANDLGVRQKLRNRARYEAANNSYARGMIDTLACDVIGTGPRVQVRTGGDRKADAYIEREFRKWARAVRFGGKLRLMRKAKCEVGEGFAIFQTNRKLRTPVKADLRVVEADRVSSSWGEYGSPNEVDGIRLDGDGNPTAYHVLRHHPGAINGVVPAMRLKGDWVPAKDVIHVFREDRPGQLRGIPELTPALPLFAQLRRYVLAVLAAAETAADYAAVIHSPEPTGEGPEPSSEGEERPEAMDVFELAQRMVTVLPEGYQLSQIKAEQPTTTFGEFKREILAEAFAAVMMPYNVGAHDSSEFNYASGKLDRLTYGRVVRVEQQLDWEPECDRCFFEWLDEAFMIPGYIPEGLPPIAAWDISWFWDEHEDIDPVKAATGRKIELNSHQASPQTISARRGIDYEEEEARIAESYGLTVEEYRRRRADKELGPARTQNDTPTASNGQEARRGQETAA